jgi:hypothetical protein
MSLQYILIKFTPPSFSLIPSPTPSKFQQASLLYFHNKYKNIIHHFRSPSLSPYAFPPHTLVSIPRKDLSYLPVLQFFKLYVDSSRGFHLGISDLYVLYFNQTTPYSHITYSQRVVLLNDHICVSSSFFSFSTKYNHFLSSDQS